MAPLLEIRDARRTFLTPEGGRLAALDGVSLSVEANEFVTLLGPSGCGKTTLLRAISGFEALDSGTMVLDGADLSALPPFRRPVNTVFQSYALFGHMSVARNVGYALEVAGVARATREAQVAEVLEKVGLAGMGARRPGQLSGGQRQRVALARSIIAKPRLLLLDEPLSALDRNLRQQMQIELKALQNNLGIAFVFVTHDQEEAMALADRVIVLHQGRVEQIGTPEEIYDRPATEFVASFVGTSNVLSGEVRGGRAALGALAVGAPPGASEGERVRAFVRPHDVEISAPVEGTSSVATARVVRLIRVGSMTRVELSLADGQALAVDLTRDRAVELGLREGDPVFVNLKDARLFVQDYEI